MIKREFAPIEDGKSSELELNAYPREKVVLGHYGGSDGFMLMVKDIDRDCAEVGLTVNDLKQLTLMLLDAYKLAKKLEKDND